MPSLLATVFVRLTVAPVVGWLAALATLLSSVPQVLRLLRGHRAGVVPASYVAWLVASLSWTFWAADVGALPSLVVNALSVPVLLIAVALLRPRPRLTSLAGLGLVAALLLRTHPAILASFASVVLLFVALPSLRHALRPHADLSGVAPSTWVLLAANNTLWVIYDVCIGHPFAGIASLALAILALAVLFRLRRTRDASRSSSSVIAGQTAQ